MVMSNSMEVNLHAANITARSTEVSALVLRPFIEALRASGVDVDKMLREARIDPVLCQDPAARVPLDRLKSFCRAAPDAVGDETFGLRAGTFASPPLMHLLGYISKSCATAGEALRSAQQYLPLLSNDVEFRLSVKGDCATIRFVYPEPMPRVVSDYTIGGAVRLGEMLVGQRLPLIEIQLSYRKPLQYQEYLRFFGTRVRFGCAYDALVCSANLLEMPLVDADEQLCKILKKEAERALQDLPVSPGFVATVRRVIADALTQGGARVEDVARRLGVGTRTMRRRLQEEGTSYTQILDHVRRSRAFLYLEEESRSIGEIASLLAFADQSTFNRAFKRWTGEGPRQWRAGSRVSNPPPDESTDTGS